jgi:ubiquinone/menaquinone biosynthesis C-methylase UbiE
MARGAGIDAVRASVLDLPFGDHSFDGAWTMSTLLHVPDLEFDAAIHEIVRVLEPGSPVGIGLWGGVDWEGTADFDTISPPRFFSIRSDERLRTMLRPHGDIERFVTHDFGDEHSWHYQWLVLRTGS